MKIGNIPAYAAALMLSGYLCAIGRAESIPYFIGDSETSELQASPNLQGLHFVAALDDPPFSFLDRTSKISGFSVFLARAVCEELNYSSNCFVSGRVAADLDLEMNPGAKKIIISNFRIESLSWEKFRFSRPFLRIPGRFVIKRTGSAPVNFDEGLQGSKIGTIANSGEERMLRSFFPQAQIVGFAGESLLLNELSSGKIDLAFANGIQAGQWLVSREGDECCMLAGGPYYSSHFLGAGVRFAIPAEDSFLVPQINGALISLQRKGKIEELFFRFFPINFFEVFDRRTERAAID